MTSFYFIKLAETYRGAILFYCDNKLLLFYDFFLLAQKHENIFLLDLLFLFNRFLLFYFIKRKFFIISHNFSEFFIII